MGKSSVFVNGQGMSSTNSGAVSVSGPDVCLTPIGNALVPVPYINIAKSSSLAEGTKTVKIDGSMGAIDGCCYSTSTGDQPGTGKGVASGTVGDKAEFINCSFDVKIEGKGACRNSDPMTHNNRNALGVNQDSAAGPPSGELEAELPEKGTFRFRVVEHLSWDAYDKDTGRFKNGHKDNKPIDGRKFKIGMPDGSEIERTTDDDGMIELTGQDPCSTYEIAFVPENDKLSYKYHLFYNRFAPIKRVRQNDRNGDVLKSCKSDLKCGVIHTISMWQPTVILDAHMHIQSGHCAPLQYVQSLSVVTSVMSRGWIEGSGSVGGHVLEFLFEPLIAPMRAFVRALSDEQKNPQEGFFKAAPLRELSEQSKKTTKEIGIDFMRERNNVYDNYFKKDEFYEGARNLILSGVIMTMDMEYAHIDGYFGIKVYNALYNTKEDIDKEEPVAYWTPQHGRWVKKKSTEGELIGGYIRVGRRNDIYIKAGTEGYAPSHTTLEEYEKEKTAAEVHGIIGTFCDMNTKKTKHVKIDAVPVLIPHSETKKYENWGKQLRHTEHAVLANPLKLLPLFHYDPRRWQLADNTEPMSKVTKKGIYLGFKMYTSQGYRPWEPRLPILEDFYAQCCNGHIPIMTHCTPDGAATFERDQYRDFEHPNMSPEDTIQKKDRSKRDYFNEHFVSPEAWKVVLDKKIGLDDGNTSSCKTVQLSDLHLCLAHFGGPTKLGMKWNRQIIDMVESRKYPNLYTDISSSFADSGFRDYFKKIVTGNPAIKHRILFGTDWFLTFFYKLIPTVGKNLWDYCVDTRTFLDSFDTSLWPAFTQYNPYRFYRLDEQIQRIADNIIVKRQTKEIEDILGPINIGDIEDILKEAAYIKMANEGNVNYEETP